MEDQLLVSLLAIVGFFYAAGTSYIQERFGKFQDLSPTKKQLVNSVLNFIVPAVAVFVQPYWKADFGSLDGALQSLFVLLVPVVVWLFSQVAHQIDKLLERL